MRKFAYNLYLFVASVAGCTFFWTRNVLSILERKRFIILCQNWDPISRSWLLRHQLALSSFCLSWPSDLYADRDNLHISRSSVSLELGSRNNHVRILEPRATKRAIPSLDSALLRSRDMVSNQHHRIARISVHLLAASKPQRHVVLHQCGLFSGLVRANVQRP